MTEPEAPTTASGAAEPEVSSDFIFGTLATDSLRIAQHRLATSGIRHGHDLEPIDPQPGTPVRVRVSVGPEVAADHVTCYWTDDGRDPLGDRGVARVGHALELRQVATRWDTLLWGYVEEWEGELPGVPAGTEVAYRLQAWSANGAASVWAAEVAALESGDRPPGVPEAAALTGGPDGAPMWPVFRGGPYAYVADEEQVPDWFRDAVIYHVFVDRFSSADGRPLAEPDTLGGVFGGTLSGVTRSLDHIASLGTTCIWLSPIFASPSHHGYDTTDYLHVEPRLGTEADLVDLVRSAHERGMRVILDLAANHVSVTHPAFVRAQADASSPEADWFTFIPWPDRYVSFFGVQTLPQLDTDNPAVRQHLIEAALHWLDLGVDGFRCDYAIGPSHAFWSAFRAATRARHPESVTVGEIVETGAAMRTYTGRLDGSLDFLTLQALRSLVVTGDLAPSRFEAFVERHDAYLSSGLALPSFLDNHDMNRFLWVVRGDRRRLRLAALCQYTLPGPPIVYYGTEVGLSQRRDVRGIGGDGRLEESRLPMLWGEDQDHDLLAFYQRLGAMRGRDASRWRTGREVLHVDDEAGLLVVRCGAGAGAAIVALNVSPSARSIPMPLGGVWRPVLATDPDTRVLDGALRLAPYGGLVLAAT